MADRRAVRTVLPPGDRPAFRAVLVAKDGRVILHGPARRVQLRVYDVARFGVEAFRDEPVTFGVSSLPRGAPASTPYGGHTGRPHYHGQDPMAAWREALRVAFDGLEVWRPADLPPALARYFTEEVSGG